MSKSKKLISAVLATFMMIQIMVSSGVGIFKAQTAHASSLEGSTWNDRAKTVVGIVTGEIPCVGGIISGVVDLFWPDSEPNIWDEIEDQVKGEVDKEILQKEIEARKADIDTIKDTMNRYTSAKNQEKVAYMVTLIAQSDGLYEKLSQSSNDIHLIPFTVTLACMNLAILRERVDHGKEMYTEDNTVVWEKELNEAYARYRKYFLDVYDRWEAWRKSQIINSHESSLCYFSGTVVDNVTKERVYITDSKTTEGLITYCDYNAERMMNNAIALMAADLYPTFSLQRYLPGQERSPLDVNPKLETIWMGPYGVDIPKNSMELDQSESGKIKGINVREWNTIEGMQFIYGDHNGSFHGNPNGGIQHSINITNDKYVIGAKMQFLDGIMRTIDLKFSDGGSTGVLGNRDGRTGMTDFEAAVDPGYMLTGGGFVSGTGTDGTAGISYIKLQFKPYDLQTSKNDEGNEVAPVSFDAAKDYVIFNKSSGQVLDVKDGSKDDCAKIIQCGYKGALDQIWSVGSVRTNYYKLISLNSGKVADVTGGSNADGANVIQYKYTGAYNQDWQIIDVGGGYYEIISASSGKAMSVNAGTGEIVQMTLTGSDSQLWSIVEVPHYAILKIAFSFNGITAGKLMGITTAMEYSLDGGVTYKAASSNDMALSAAEIAGITAANGIKVRIINGIIFKAPISIAITAGPAAPAVTGDDTKNTVTGIDTTMEFSTDNGSAWTKYTGSNLPNLTGNTTLMVRKAATGTTLAGSATTMKFTFDGAPQSNIKIACDDAYELYINGILVGTGSGWETPQDFSNLPLTPGKNVIAIKGIDKGGVAAMVADAAINGKRIATDNSWKVSTTDQTGWNAVNFDDSNWKNATDYGSAYGASTWGSGLKGFSSDTPAHWIWSSNNDADNTVYFRTSINILPDGQNIAKGKTATQSTTYLNATASRAVDGNTDGNWNSGSVIHTDNDLTADAWWQVDLGKTYDINKIKIYNRTDCCSDRLSNYTVSVLDANGNVVWTNYQKDYPNPSVEIPVPNQTGRYVKISLKGILNIAEVEVYGIENIAKGKTATQSTTYLDATAGRAVDGNTDGNWNSGSVIHTDNDLTANAWWQVDLGNTYDIDKIKIYNRTDCCSDRLSNYTVSVLDANGNVVWTNYQKDYPNPSVEIPVPNQTGRYVKISLKGILNIAEVEVYGK